MKARSQLFGLWGRLAKERGLSGDRLERLHYSAAVLGREIKSWTTLLSAEKGELVRAMFSELAYKPFALHYVLWLAPRAYGDEWDSRLHQRLEGRPYHYHGTVTELDGRRMHWLIEELVDRLARAEIGKSKTENRNSEILESELPASELRAAKDAIRKRMIAAVRGGSPQRHGGAEKG